MCKRVCAICQVVYLLIYSFLFPLRSHYWFFILLDCLGLEAPTWLAVASWLLITLTRVKEINHKDFASSCWDDRNNYLIRKVTVIKWLVLHLLLWSNGVLGKPEQLKVEIWSKRESEGWGHECHEGNRTNSLLCLTTESDKLTHTSASLFSSLPLFSPLPSSSLSALIQLCICILNDSITWNPAVKIMDVFHYFSPLGHSDPSRAPIRAPSSFSHLSLSIHLSFFLLSHCRRRFFFSDKHSFACFFCDWQEIIAKWSCLCTLGTASWQKVFSW